MIISVIGAGSYGTALAQLISNNVDQVLLFGRDRSLLDNINKNNVNKRYFPSLALSSNIKALDLAKEARLLEDSNIVLFSVPSGVTKEVAKKLSPYLVDKIIISTAKGIEYPSLNTMSQLISNATASSKVFSISGPTFADELIKGFLSGFTVGADNEESRQIIMELLNSPNIICDFSEDITGVELCGVLKNIYSIAMGIFDSYSQSNNEHHAFLNLCFKEMKYILDHTVSDTNIINKFCCFGDFNLTTNTDKSRNRTLGLMVGKGLLRMNEFNPSIIFEGIKSVKAIRKKSKDLNLNIPIINFVFQALNQKTNIKISIEMLLKDIKSNLT